MVKNSKQQLLHHQNGHKELITFTNWIIRTVCPYYTHC